LTRDWTPDAPVDAELAARLLADADPTYAGATVRPLGVGWDNAAFLVDDRIVLRVAQRRLAAALLANEARWLPVIAPALPLRVPDFVVRSTPRLTHPWPFVAYRWLPGVGGDVVGADVARRNAGRLGAFLAALHAVDVPDEAPTDELHRMIPSHRHRWRHDLVTELDAAGVLPVAAARIRAHLDALVALPPSDAPPCWVHGDLHPRHLLHEDGALTAVIDWGDLHAGDRAVDLTPCWTWLDADGAADLLDAYGPVDAGTRERARLRALHVGLAMLWYGTEVGDAAMTSVGRHALCRTTGSLARDDGGAISSAP
jgi:aminoglycoside phosphotransferase (APT) family kinase protein